jgi:hypothetical protein
VALEICDTYVKLWNPDYQYVCVYSEQWTVGYWKGNTWKDTGVGSQLSTWKVTNDSECVNITRVHSLVGVGQLNVTYVLRKGAFLKHNVVFQSYSGTTYEYRVVMALAGIVNNHVKTDSEEFDVAGETRKNVPFFYVGSNNSNLVLTENLMSVYNSTLKDIVFNTHAQGIKADIIIIIIYPFINEKLQAITPITYFWVSAAATFILWGITCAIAFANPVETFLNKILSDAKRQGAVETQLLEDKSRNTRRNV